MTKDCSMASPEFNGLDASVLIATVKAAQKHRLKGTYGFWNEYLAAKHPTIGYKDPTRHSKGVLADFLKSLCTDTDSEGNSRLLASFVTWQQEKSVEPNITSAPTDLEGSSAAVQTGLWGLVRKTEEHSRYKESYSMPSYLEGWKRITRKPSDPTIKPRLLAVDCEMCETEFDDRSLLGVCVVDARNSIIFKSLVKPKGKVIDFRSHVTGITAEDLEGVAMTLEDVQRVMMGLLGPNTILVGHSLHHDLHTLHIDHRPVIDTSFIFSYKGLPKCTPSLAHLAKAVLGLEMRGGETGEHDSFEDASIAMRLVQHQLQQGVPEPISPPDIKVPKEELRRLLAHHLPADVTEEELKGVFSGGPPCLEVEGDASSGRAMLCFQHPGMADDAFRLLKGPHSTDSAGRATKQVQLAGGQWIRIRKMACHNGLAFGKDTGRSQREPPTKSNAKQPSGVDAGAGVASAGVDNDKGTGEHAKGDSCKESPSGKSGQLGRDGEASGTGRMPRTSEPEGSMGQLPKKTKKERRKERRKGLQPAGGEKPDGDIPDQGTGASIKNGKSSTVTPAEQTAVEGKVEGIEKPKGKQDGKTENGGGHDSMKGGGKQKRKNEGGSRNVAVNGMSSAPSKKKRRSIGGA